MIFVGLLGVGCASRQTFDVTVTNRLGEPITVEADYSRFRKADKLVQKADITRLRQLLSWQPEVSLRDGLRQLLEYEKLLPSREPQPR